MEQTYEDASARLEAIIARLDSGEAGLRETLELCREGRTLVEHCAAELDAVGQGLRSCGSTSWSPGSSPAAPPRVDARRGRGRRGALGERRGALWAPRCAGERPAG